MSLIEFEIVSKRLQETTSGDLPHFFLWSNILPSQILDLPLIFGSAKKAIEVFVFSAHHKNVHSDIFGTEKGRRVLKRKLKILLQL